jgi:hypothetical protein
VDRLVLKKGRVDRQATGDPGKGIALQRALAKFGIRQVGLLSFAD